MDYSFLPRIPFKLVSDSIRLHNSLVFPFKEEPANPDDQEHDKYPNKVNAIDLFNLFTADIIRMDVLFTK